jgi:flagellar biosynthesis/type III secretory pathway M-ring protein FliF/YscJ
MIMLMWHRKQWGDMTTTQQAGLVLMGVIQVALLAAALIDIRRRSAAELNGSKRLWTLAAFVNFIGPLAYFIFGRKLRP